MIVYVKFNALNNGMEDKIKRKKIEDEDFLLESVY